MSEDTRYIVESKTEDFIAIVTVNPVASGRTLACAADLPSKTYGSAEELLDEKEAAEKRWLNKFLCEFLL